MASEKKSPSSKSDLLPFGAGAIEDFTAAVDSGKKRSRGRRRSTGKSKADPKEKAGAKAGDAEAKPASEGGSGAGGGKSRSESGEREGGERAEGERPRKRRRWQDRRRRRKNKNRDEGGGEGNQGQGRPPRAEDADGSEKGKGGPGGKGAAPETVTGMLVLEKANHGHLRKPERDYLGSKSDPHVAPRLVQKFHLTDGAMIEGKIRRGQGRHKWEVSEILSVDGMDPKEARSLRPFKSLTSIDPDFHYAVGDDSEEVSLKIIDLICPVGRGQRGLIVAPPRSGKTILLQQFAKAIEKVYPEVHLIVLLVDERPEEATEWKRAIGDGGEVYVSTNDETHKRHVELAEVVWRRCKRLVERGEDVILLMDSITRLGRAYNNVHGNSGKTMSGGIDTRALERPKQLFGSARNTETAGSLTILGTCLVETGSRMDQVIFEEFKGTGNMELVLSRRLADRRVFPALDIQKSGTRKEEKLISKRRLHLIQTLRRVLLRMHFAEAMELLITKLDQVEKTDDFLQRFEVDPEA